MQTIILTAVDLPQANPARLREELELELNTTLRVLVRQTVGLVSEAIIERIDGQPFTVEEQALVIMVANNHDPALLSTRQAQNEALDLRRGDARDRLIALGADAVRVTGLPDLAGIVADIVEALDLDIG